MVFERNTGTTDCCDGTFSFKFIRLTHRRGRFPSHESKAVGSVRTLLLKDHMLVHSNSIYHGNQKPSFLRVTNYIL